MYQVQGGARTHREAGPRRSELAFAEAILPGSSRIPPADEATLAEVDRLLEHVDRRAPAIFARAQQALDAAAVVSTGRPFHRLGRAEQQRLLERWEQDRLLRGPLALVALVYKFVHFDRRPVYERFGGRLNVVEHIEQPRWMSQISRGDDWVGQGDLEAEVVVVGTGAGGAVVGRELAERGVAVLFVEEGEHVRRDRFDGSSRTAHLHFYRAAFSLGNAPMPVFIGRMVGGSTAVNGGTCFKTPPWVLNRWCEALGTKDFSPEAMERHFERVFDILEVAPSPASVIGPMGDIMRRGADALGYRHFPVLRNAPGCNGLGFCDFGCRTDARRSTNLSYIPPALERGGQLVTELRAEELLMEGGRAVGLSCRTRSGATVRVRAPAVILAGGAVPTPAFLLRQGIGNRSGQVGKNLTLHPSGGVAALMPERVHGMGYVPQGYGIDEFMDKGLLITGASPDYNYAPLLFPVTGERLMRRLEQIEHIANFGVLVADQSRGRVRLGPGGAPVITYNLGQADADRLKEGLLHTAEMVRAAGATEVYPAVQPGTVLRRDADWRAFRDRKLSGSDLLLTSYHPLGTCRMSQDPAEGVVNIDHEAHDVRGLFLVDGSVVSGPLGVNPQITIMAVATRAAERIAARLG